MPLEAVQAHIQQPVLAYVEKIDTFQRYNPFFSCLFVSIGVGLYMLYDLLMFSK